MRNNRSIFRADATGKRSRCHSWTDLRHLGVAMRGVRPYGSTYRLDKTIPGALRGNSYAGGANYARQPSSNARAYAL